MAGPGTPQCRTFLLHVRIWSDGKAVAHVEANNHWPSLHQKGFGSHDFVVHSAIIPPNCKLIEIRILHSQTPLFAGKIDLEKLAAPKVP